MHHWMTIFGCLVMWNICVCQHCDTWCSGKRRPISIEIIHTNAGKKTTNATNAPKFKARLDRRKEVFIKVVVATANLNLRWLLLLLSTTPTGATGFTIHQLVSPSQIIGWKKTSESKNVKKKLHQYPWKFFQALLKFHLSNQVPPSKSAHETAMQVGIMPCQEIVLLWSGFEVLHLQCHLLSHPDPRKTKLNIDDFNQQLWLDT